MNKGSFAIVPAVAFILLLACACFTGLQADGAASAAPATTLDNLMAAYNGESNAHARYLAFAKKASEEGYDVAAGLFRAAALAEKIHYERHAKLIKKLGGEPKATIEAPDVKSTRENLESALKAETYEKDVMYAGFLRQAEKEDDEDIIDAFEDARAAEGVHAEMYARMLKNLTFSKGLTKEYYVCPLCGNVTDALTSALCPICSTPTKEFKKVR